MSELRGELLNASEASCQALATTCDDASKLSGRKTVSATETHECAIPHVQNDSEGAEGRPKIPAEVTPLDMYLKSCSVHTEERKAAEWENAAEMVKTYSDEMVARWNKEIDTYLVYAGLFSAILTAFNVQSYLLLQPAAPDPSIAILQQISSQLGSFSINLPFVNSTQSTSANRLNTGAGAAPPIPRWAVWLNTLWFSSLILSLTSASVGIMVKQWLNEYTSGVSGTSRHAARVRQHRLNNLKQWRVEDIVGTVPVLLQLALAFFLAGLLVLLWTLHVTVAAVASALVGLLAAFTVATSLLPLFCRSCAYLSPQARALESVWRPGRFLFWAYRFPCILGGLYRNALLQVANATSFTLRSIRSTLTTLPSRLLERRTNTLLRWFSKSCTDDTPRQTWRGREQSEISRLAADIDRQMLLEAYTATLHPDALSAATVCLMGFSSAHTVEYFRQLHASVRAHFGSQAGAIDGPLGWETPHLPLWLNVLLCALMEEGSPLSEEETASLSVYISGGSWPARMHVGEAAWAISTLYSIMEDKDAQHRPECPDEHRLLRLRGLLIGNAARKEAPLTNVFLQDVSRAYRRVRLNQPSTTNMSAFDAHAGYLHSVNMFLACAAPAFKYLPLSDDLRAIRTYAEDVVTDFVRTLCTLLETDRTRSLQSTIDTNGLMNVLLKLYRLRNSVLAQLVSDELVPDIVRMVDMLAEAPSDGQSNLIEDVKACARDFRERVLHVKDTPVPRAVLAKVDIN